ncbi:(2Fe-2S)-binding protein [Desulfopila sp. IMCC35008]|uniref:(2Fe-2S)-binding protein n=1 Tax=Desulfopila sp. IMCC35008 TaxID=2653858 RepID=UPI0013D2DCEF|nr:2Fe-2S iron-sulfur cluster-binding protein [Desulfopila sp. IMCC35008]
MIELNVNGQQHTVEAEPDELLVWVLREKIGLTSTKFGCGIEMCGACNVLIDGVVTRSCSTKLSEVSNKLIVTREKVSEDHLLNSNNGC